MNKNLRLVGLVCALWASAALGEDEKKRTSVTIGALAPPLFGLVLNTYGSFLEFNFAVHDHFSVIAEFGNLKSNNFRTMGGTVTNLRIDVATYCGGVAWWLKRPLDGLFVSVRVEGWLASAMNPAGVAAVGNAFDANFQPGWQWNFGSFTAITSLSFAYVNGPIRSQDGTVEFPIQGFSVTPHIRLGYAW